LNRSWTVRRYEPSDDARISELLRTVFPTWKGGDYWTWVHKSNPMGFYGREGDIWVAEASDGRIIGHYAITRYSCWYFSRIVTGAQSLHTSTHPDFRRQGIIQELASRTYVDAARNGVKFIFGFPNRYSLPALLNLKWADCGVQINYHKVLDHKRFVDSKVNGAWTPAARAFLWAIDLKLTPLRGLQGKRSITIERGIHEDVRPVWESIRGKHDLAIERTNAYLNWRYNSHWGDYHVFSALKGGSMVGYVVYKVVYGREICSISICDILTEDDDEGAYGELFDFVAQEARLVGATHVVVSPNSSKAFMGVIKKRNFHNLEGWLWGFWDRRSSHGLLYLLGTNAHPVLHKLRWYHSIGDCDAE
jgi:GNAT superfamily N-acetyltransferase